MDGSMERGAPAALAQEVPALPRCCPHCRHPRLQRWGVTGRGLARLRCGGCRRTCTPVTGTPGSGLRHRAAFEATVDDMLGRDSSSCRKLAARLGVHHMTVWRWRIRVLGRFVRHRPAEVGVGVGAGAGVGGVVFTRESRKASREWVNHARWPALHPPPPRPRWYELARGEAPPGGWAAWRVALRLDGSPGSPSISPPGAGDLQARFERFLAPFRGPATRYLAGYAAWMRVRDVIGGEKSAA